MANPPMFRSPVLPEWYPERDESPEWMDDLSVRGRDLHQVLNDIHTVNRWLGGHRVVVRSLRREVERRFAETGRPVRIYDLGCGGGDTLRTLARFFKRLAIPVRLTGLDANPHTVALARELGDGTPGLDFTTFEVGSDPIPTDGDVYLCSLFLHHFSRNEIQGILNEMLAVPGCLILINDLHRHRLAHLLFDFWSRLMRLSPQARMDGLISIRRSFRRTELLHLVETSSPGSFRLSWHWAFRWQLVLRSTS